MGITARRRWLRETLCFLAPWLLGCQKNELPVTAAALPGKWRLVRAGGQSPAAFQIKSVEMEIASDGTWQSTTEMQGNFAGMIVKGEGKWSVTNGVISYTAGANAGQSRAGLEGNRLVLDPDFMVRKNGKIEVAGEYERD
jgi:hypothetical protein